MLTPAKKIGFSLRMRPEEKVAFDRAADLAGLSLNSWLISRARLMATDELEKRGETVPFLRPAKKKPLQ
jgi:uncharacterized protein (DUF1778 family)